MKKSRKIVCGLGVSLCLLLNMNSSFAATGKVNVEAVRIRTQANTTSEVLDVAYENDSVEIIGETGEWYKVKFNGETGYTLKKYIDNKDATSTNESTASNEVQPEETAPEENTNTTATNINENISVEELVGTQVKINNPIKINLLPTITSKFVSEIEKNSEIKIVYDLKNWIKIENNSVTGWVPEAILKNSIISNNTTEETTAETTKEPEVVQEKTEETQPKESETSEQAVNKKGYINVETANVREKPDKKSTLLNTLDESDPVNIVAEDGDWYKIESGNISGYVLKTLITIGNTTSSRGLSEERNALVEQENKVEEEVQTSNEPVNTSVSSTSVSSNDVVEYAKQFLGKSYVLGGKNPETGFDCSGFTKYVFKNFGYTLGSVAADQISSGEEVSKENLQPGDLLLFYDEGKTRIGHVGIYEGNDQFIHAANSTRGVVEDGLTTNSYYNTRFVAARRIVK